MIGSFVDNRYKVKKLLGQGNMAEVYLAEDVLNDNHKVALKVIKEELNKQAALRRRFRGEFEVCEKFNHRNIVKVYSIGDLENGLCYYAMEYLPHPSLEDILEKEGTLSEDKVLMYLRQVAFAFEHFHPFKVVHRDLKPANVIIGDDDRVILVDFGLAKDHDRTVLTKTGMIIGTPLYLSPEQVSGQKVDTRADIWALGVMGYTMLSGVEPFREKNMQMVAHKIMKGRPKPITELVEGIKPKWNAFFRKCFKKRPEDRYQNGDEILEALDRLAGGLAPGRLLDSASQGDTELIEAVEIVDSERKKAEPPPQPDLRKQVAAVFCGLLIVFIGLWALGVFSSKKYIAEDLVVLPGVGSFEVRWRSEQPYLSKVVLDGKSSKIYTTQGERSDSLQHRVIVSGLDEGKRYGFSILFPSGEKTPSRWVQTDAFICQVKNLEGEKLTLFVPGAKSGLLKITDKRQQKKTVEGQFDELGENISFHIPPPLQLVNSLSLSLDYGPDSKRRVDMKSIFNEVAKEFKRKADKVDGPEITKERYVRYAASLSTVMATVQKKKGSLEISKELREREQVRRQKFAKESSEIISERLKNTGIRKTYEQACKASPIILGTNLFDYEQRSEFYRSLIKVVEPMLFVAYQKGPHFGWPIPDLGRFALSYERMKGSCNEVVLVGKDGIRQNRLRLGSSTPFLTHKVPTSEKFTFNVEKRGDYDAIELAMLGSSFQTGGLEIELNDGTPILFFGPPLIKEAPKKGTVYQPLPIEALRSGRNDISISFTAMHNQRIKHTVYLDAIIVRLRRKSQ